MFNKVLQNDTMWHIVNCMYFLLILFLFTGQAQAATDEERVRYISYLRQRDYDNQVRINSELNYIRMKVVAAEDNMKRITDSIANLSNFCTPPGSKAISCMQAVKSIEADIYLSRLDHIKATNQGINLQGFLDAYRTWLDQTSPELVKLRLRYEYRTWLNR
jgi:hypothetical protein